MARRSSATAPEAFELALEAGQGRAESLQTLAQHRVFIKPFQNGAPLDALDLQAAAFLGSGQSGLGGPQGLAELANQNVPGVVAHVHAQPQPMKQGLGRPAQEGGHATGIAPVAGRQSETHRRGAQPRRKIARDSLLKGESDPAPPEIHPASACTPTRTKIGRRRISSEKSNV